MRNIPFENKPSLTKVEERAEKKLEANWDFVVRTTPGIREDFEKKWPELSKQIGKKIGREAEDPSKIFRPGIPDFLAFNETAEYKFVEVKGEADGLRSSQLRWIRDHRELNVEIWFADSNDQIKDKMEASKIESYSLKTTMGDGDCCILENEGRFLVELPASLAAMMNLDDQDNVHWGIMDETRLILNTD